MAYYITPLGVYLYVSDQKNMQYHVIYLLTLMIISCSSFAGGPVLPKEYRFIKKTELSSNWRKQDPNKYVLVVGDFNNDSLVDGAQLAIKVKTNELVLLAFLAIKNKNHFEWVELNSTNYDSIKYMGIKTIKPKEIDYYNYPDDNKTKIKLTSDSIKYFASEGAASVFYWDNNLNKFKRIWVSK